MPVLSRSVGSAADWASSLDLFRQEVELIRRVSVVPASPVRFEAGDVSGRRASREEDANEEEAPRNKRRRSSSEEDDGRGPARI